MIYNDLIGGVVILYNPPIGILPNIYSYLEQVNELLLFDNSIEEKPWLTDFVRSKKKIIYKSFNKNLGVAFALNYAADLFIKLDYKFLLTMDQDSKAAPEMVSKLFCALDNKDKVGIISPYHLNKLDSNKIPDKVLEDKLVVMTSGNLLNLEAYKSVGPFNNEFFIDYVDIEYCLRLNLNNYKILRVNSAILFHNLGDITQKRLLFRSVYPYNHTPERMYFKVRNRFYLRYVYKKIFPDYFEYEFPLFRNMIFKILLFEKQRIKKIKYAIKGFIDYKKGVNYSPFET